MMKISFTQEDLDAIEVAYYDNEGYSPCEVGHIPEQKEYQVLQKLWLAMAAKQEHKSKKEKYKEGWNEE